MRQTALFTKTRREAPRDEVAKNAQLLIRAGYVHKEMAGVYSFLPLGFRVIEKISDIVKKEMDKIGGLQVKSSALQKPDLWSQTKRWDEDVWFKTKLQEGGDLGLAFTHEEPFANFMKYHIKSYKDLPAYPYDIRTMFRNEKRCKSGLMRGREFYWKALYSFSADEEEHNNFYEKVQQAYSNIYKQVGLGDLTYLTFASGGSFSKFSHEFQTLSEVGEDFIYIDEEKNIAINKEVYTDSVLQELGVKKQNLIERKAIEVGNIFSLGERFSRPLGLSYKDETGNENFVYMGSYGLGITRLLGTVVEVLSDEKGIVWPESIAPFQIHLISLDQDEQAEKIYKQLQDKGREVLFDDRDIKAGEKFADADLMGLTLRVVVSEKSLQAGGVEIKKRNEEQWQIIKIGDLLNK